MTIINKTSKIYERGADSTQNVAVHSAASSSGTTRFETAVEKQPINHDDLSPRSSLPIQIPAQPPTGSDAEDGGDVKNTEKEKNEVKKDAKKDEKVDEKKEEKKEKNGENLISKQHTKMILHAVHHSSEVSQFMAQEAYAQGILTGMDIFMWRIARKLKKMDLRNSTRETIFQCHGGGERRRHDVNGPGGARAARRAARRHTLFAEGLPRSV
jgi:hypothetical protein